LKARGRFEETRNRRDRGQKNLGRGGKAGKGEIEIAGGGRGIIF